MTNQPPAPLPTPAQPSTRWLTREEAADCRRILGIHLTDDQPDKTQP